MFIDVPAPYGILEGVLWTVPRPRALAVVLHPHSQLGGTMHHHAPYRIARALREKQVSCLRFNFRGVGRSTGTFADGIGEQDDVRTALEFLAARTPDVPLWITGFSFGAYVGLCAASDSRIRAVLLAGAAVKMFDHATPAANVSAPVAVIQGERDELAAPDEVRAAMPSADVHVIARADHNFSAHLDELEQSARERIDGFLA
jgi:hypothetical protein